jgi:nucleoside-diphosphate-sugar epimerase
MLAMITLLGATGFIGSNILKKMESETIPFYAPARDEEFSGKSLGDIIYCIGLTNDAKYKPFETLEAQVNKLKYIIERCQFDSITYCSSTRIYIHNGKDTDESSLINVAVTDPFEFFNLTKLTAESLLVNTVKNYKVVRLSNIFGNDFNSDNFLTSIIKDALTTGKIVLRSSSVSQKDYLHVSDAANIITAIASNNAASGIYNVASGFNISNGEILEVISGITKCEVEYAPDAQNIIFSPIAVKRIRNELGFRPGAPLLETIPQIIEDFKKHLGR